MPGRALLIGAETNGLGGVANDVSAMEEALKPFGIVSKRCEGTAATRDGILAAYRALIADTEPEDAAVVYYAGHGGLALPPENGGRGFEPAHLQFIAPVDLDDSTRGDFRGITAAELSLLLAQLTRRTRNVTVIFDCCHAAHMSRDPDLRVRALSWRPAHSELRAHIDRLRRDGVLDEEPPRPTGNEHAVRIVACAPEQSAFEYRNVAGRQVGMLTEALTRALAEAGTHKVTWATVMDRVRRQVLDREPGQRPEAEGPSRRLLFDTAQDDPLAALPVTVLGGGHVRLECAPLLGVRRGDTFAILPPGAVVTDAAAVVGDLLIDRIEPLAAQGVVMLRSPGAPIPLGARAHRVTAAAPTMPVLLPKGHEQATALARAVHAAPMLRAAEPAERWRAKVVAGPSGELTIEDRIGPLHSPRAASATGQIVRDLTTLAQAEALRAIAANHVWRLGAQVTVEWGLVRDGARSALPRYGATVRVGDHIYVGIRNHASADVFVSLIDIGLTGRITVLTRYSPSGERLAAGRQYVFGLDPYLDRLVGVPLAWPRGLDRARPRPETVVILISSAPQDVSALEQDGIAARRAPRAHSRSPLESLIDQVATGHSRDVLVSDARPVRYDVHTLGFSLEPPAETHSPCPSVEP